MGKRFKTSSLRDERHGKILKIVPEEPRSKLGNLPPRPYLLEDPEDLVHLNWFKEWRP